MKLKCAICGEEKSPDEAMPIELLRPSLIELIRKRRPDLTGGGSICLEDLTRLRAEYVEDSLEEEKGELSNIEKEVVNSLKEQETLTRNTNEEYEKNLTLGERVADRVAEFGGSWSFIICFASVLALWVAVNTLHLFTKPFDPYPFIFLNLILSCVAAIQAPVIMMSQNRQETRDQLRAENDYRINLKAELEIRHLNDKLDYLLTKQWRRLLEIQQIQIDLTEEILPELRARKKAGGGGDSQTC